MDETPRQLIRETRAPIPACRKSGGSDLQLVEPVRPAGKPASEARGDPNRPWLMSAVGRRTEHAGQTTITLTGLHADFGKVRAALMRVSALLQSWVVSAAEQLNPTTVWNLVCDHLKRIVAGIAGPPQPLRLAANLVNYGF